MIGHLIAHAKAELNLNTMQQQMFDAAVANSKAGPRNGPCAAPKVRDTLQAELAKPEPNLAAVAAAADAARSEGRAARGKAIRDEWLALYETVQPRAEGGRARPAAEADERRPNRSGKRCASGCISFATGRPARHSRGARIRAIDDGPALRRACFFAASRAAIRRQQAARALAPRCGSARMPKRSLPPRP